MSISLSYPIKTFRNLCGPLIDVRSPIEFQKGHWPGAKSLPLFSDEEREAIGKSYKNQGKEQAVFLGLKIINPKLNKLKEQLKELMEIESQKQELIIAKKFLRIYCWRGGMRSASIGWFANLLNIKTAILTGGYKAYRNWSLEQFKYQWDITLLAGKTGTGKTDLLLEMSERGIPVIDLEGLANHRGSSFGGLGLPTQPTTEHYENQIAEALEKCKESRYSSIWIEAESSSLGKCRIPIDFFKQMRLGAIVEITRGHKERIERLIHLYGAQKKDELKESTLRIQKRLGPQRTRAALEAIDKGQLNIACDQMLDYYDRCYDYELSKSERRRNTLDISGLSNKVAAHKLLEEGLIK